MILGTFSAHLQPAQAELARAVLAAKRPTVTVALRTPWDLTAYPEATTHVCSFGILPPTTEALAAALFGEAPFQGRLPVQLGDLYPRGHGLVRTAQRHDAARRDPRAAGRRTTPARRRPANRSPGSPRRCAPSGRASRSSPRGERRTTPRSTPSTSSRCATDCSSRSRLRRRSRSTARTRTCRTRW